MIPEHPFCVKSFLKNPKDNPLNPCVGLRTYEIITAGLRQTRLAATSIMDQEKDNAIDKGLRRWIYTPDWFICAGFL